MNENSVMEEICFPQFFIECLHRLYWAEKHFIASLAKTIETVSSSALKKTLEDHFNNTCSHIITMVDVFDLKKITESETSCKVMAQIIAEVDRIIIETEYGSDLRNTALIIVLQKAVRYEITSYSRVHDFLTLMGETDVSRLLTTILEEERIVGIKLSELENKFIDKITKIP